jgi:hypothetical protein
MDMHMHTDMQVEMDMNMEMNTEMNLNINISMNMKMNLDIYKIMKINHFFALKHSFFIKLITS